MSLSSVAVVSHSQYLAGHDHDPFRGPWTAGGFNRTFLDITLALDRNSPRFNLNGYVIRSKQRLALNPIQEMAMTFSHEPEPLQYLVSPTCPSTPSQLIQPDQVRASGKLTAHSQFHLGYDDHSFRGTQTSRRFTPPIQHVAPSQTDSMFSGGSFGHTAMSRSQLLPGCNNTILRTTRFPRLFNRSFPIANPPRTATRPTDSPRQSKFSQNAMSHSQCFSGRRDAPYEATRPL